MSSGAAQQAASTMGGTVSSPVAASDASTVAATQQAVSSNESAVKIGIGVGLAIGLLILIVLCVIAYALIRRRRKAKKEVHDAAQSPISEVSFVEKTHEAPTSGVGIYEMNGQHRGELEDHSGSHFVQGQKTGSISMELEDHATSKLMFQSKSEDAETGHRAELE
jgi:flagellar biosynthesis/type III secretory pathway M-ring protein FliF/YscJ